MYIGYDVMHVDLRNATEKLRNSYIHVQLLVFTPYNYRSTPHMIARPSCLRSASSAVALLA